MNRELYIDLLKFIAIVLMILDHIGHFLLPEHLFTTHVIRGIGRVAMPLFFITHGYLLAHSRTVPSLSRIAKLLVYGSFLSISLYALHHSALGLLPLNILFQFALIEIIWRMTRIEEKNHQIINIAIIISLVTIISLTLEIYTLSQNTLDQIIDYGAFPLLYSLSGMMLTQEWMRVSASVLFAASLAFEYNYVLVLVVGLSTDNSLLYFLTPTLLLPLLYHYIPNNNIKLSVMCPLIQTISKHALSIYIIHLQFIIAYLLITHQFQTR